MQGEGRLEAIPASSSQTLEPYDAETLGISAEMLEAYQTEIRRLNLLWVSEASSEPEIVYLSVKGNGSDIEKTIVYQSTPPTDGKVVDKITEAEVETHGRVDRFMRDNWYLYAQPFRIKTLSSWSA